MTDKDRKGGKGDILNISDPRKPERILLLDPKEMELRGDKPLVARTDVEIKFKSEEDLLKCVEILRESDEHLKNRPEELKLWNWESTYREGLIIHFGVAWYDLGFFSDRKNAWKDAAHMKDYSKFNASLEDMTVRHEILINK